MGERLKQVYLPSDSRLDLPGEGHNSSHSLAIIHVRPGSLTRYGTGVNHYQM